MPVTCFANCSEELRIIWIGAHRPEAKRRAVIINQGTLRQAGATIGTAPALALKNMPLQPAGDRAAAAMREPIPAMHKRVPLVSRRSGVGECANHSPRFVPQLLGHGEGVDAKVGPPGLLLPGRVQRAVMRPA
jgi:hypothetical protein